MWTFILYIPYALYMSSFSYANGDEPGEFSEGLFICGSSLWFFGAVRTRDERRKNVIIVMNVIGFMRNANDQKHRNMVKYGELWWNQI